MAKRKFGNYTVNIKKGAIGTRSDGLIQAECTLTGDIEIGIKMETMTWREDWLAKQLFGDDASRYRLINVENRFSGYCVNRVISVWQKRF